MIEEVAGQKSKCLNMKSEWAGSKLPGLLVTRIKGLSRKAVKEEGDKQQREQQEEKNREEEG